jgi:hypothetical protein
LENNENKTMKNKLKQFVVAGMALAAPLSLNAQTGAADVPHAYGDADLNAALSISDAMLWLQNTIVPLAMLVVFLGVIIILVEQQYRQNKILNKKLGNPTEMSRENLESN